jgi:hypothetical protein
MRLSQIPGVFIILNRETETDGKLLVLCVGRMPEFGGCMDKGELDKVVFLTKYRTPIKKSFKVLF